MLAPTGKALKDASGSIRVGSDESTGILGPLVTAFEASHPKIKVSVSYTTSDSYPQVIETDSFSPATHLMFSRRILVRDG